MNEILKSVLEDIELVLDANSDKNKHHLEKVLFSMQELIEIKKAILAYEVV